MNITIRKWKMTDAADLSEALNNKRILDNLRDGLPYPYTVADAENYIQAMLTADENSTFAFAISVDNNAVGSIAAFRQSNIHSRSCEIGYYLAEPLWNKGIATVAVRQICNYIFANTDIIRIFAEPFADNIGSCRVLEKAGFTCEGTLRSNAVKNAKVLDMKMYSILKE